MKSEQVGQVSLVEVVSFYKFVDLSSELERLQSEMQALLGLKGLILLAAEGINGTVAGFPSAIEALKDYLGKESHFRDMDFKSSTCSKLPFPRWKVEIKPQTITYLDDVEPKGDRGHLSPQEWHDLIQSQEPITVLDTRNTYETKVGKFKGAIDPQIDNFTEFSDYLDSCDLPKDQTTLIYCTGGIRCEKAILDMERRGFSKVHQLQGGILKYLEAFPNQAFEGECFVFDKRVALDQELKPSQQYGLCPHCGNPGEEVVECQACQKVCKLCLNCSPEKPTCSKNCQYHLPRILKSRDKTISSQPTSNKHRSIRVGVTRKPLAKE